MFDGGKLRIGLLGASRVATTAIIAPASVRSDVTVVGVASRDPARAASFAAAHGTRPVESYASLIEAPDIDLIYVGTHAPTHAALALRAIEAGKHVLVEKPFATRLEDAQAVADAADRAGVFVAEAMHSLHHEAWRRLLALVATGTIGDVRHIEAVYEELTPDTPAEHRWRARDGGGAMLDVGVYLIAFARAITAAEPVVTRSASARWRKHVDAASSVTLDFPCGVSADIRCALDVAPTVSRLRVAGTGGEIILDNALVPHLGYRLTVDGRAGRQHYSGAGETSYSAQLTALVATLLHGRHYAIPRHDFVGSVRAVALARSALPDQPITTS